MSAQKYDIDYYLNSFIPRPRFYLLPRPVSHFFGYRPPQPQPSKPCHPLMLWFWCFIGAFCGIALLEAVYMSIGPLNGHAVPLIIASFGATAILEYNTIESPLAQPRNVLLGQTLSALIGISITKLFELESAARFHEHRWLVGALAVGAASTIMAMTKTVHPPAGATALICATSDEFTDLGWWMIPLVLLGCVLMLASALIINNIGRKFPIYWWTPVDLASLHEARKAKNQKTNDLEKASTTIPPAVRESEDNSDQSTQIGGQDENSSLEKTSSQTLSQSNTATRLGLKLSIGNEDDIIISGDKLIIPSWIAIDEYETTLLQSFQVKLREKKDLRTTRTRTTSESNHSQV